MEGGANKTVNGSSSESWEREELRRTGDGDERYNQSFFNALTPRAIGAEGALHHWIKDYLY